MSCCITDDTVETTRSEVEAVCRGDELPETDRCGSCKSKGTPVTRKTVLLMLRPELLERAVHGRYIFCPARDCPIVYFKDRGSQQFTVEDLRMRVGVKVKGGPIPLCYCFGFDEYHIRDEIERTGDTSIPDKVCELIREGLCACEARNPSGACCLGEVNKATKRLKLELAATQNG